MIEKFCAGCFVSWPPDAKSIFILESESVYQVPLPPGKMFQAAPADGPRFDKFCPGPVGSAS